MKLNWANLFCGTFIKLSAIWFKLILQLRVVFFLKTNSLAIYLAILWKSPKYSLNSDLEGMEINCLFLLQNPTHIMNKTKSRAMVIILDDDVQKLNFIEYQIQLLLKIHSKNDWFTSITMTYIWGKGQPV